MKRLRSVIFWGHLVVGVAATAVVLIMSVTGVLLTYQRQVQLWADTRGMDAGPPAAGASALPVAELVAAVAEVREGTPSAVRWRAGESRPVEIVFGRDGAVFVNGYTGAVLGTGSEGTRAFFRSMTDWHRWLAMQGDDRARGKAITGAANLAFLFIIVSGFWLWWPRKWNAAALRNITLFRAGLRPRARDFNWHNVVGFWSLVPLFVVVATAVVISYPWASDMVYRAVGEEPPAAPAGRGGAPSAAQGLALAGAQGTAQGGQPAAREAAGGRGEAVGGRGEAVGGRGEAAGRQGGRDGTQERRGIDLAGADGVVAYAREYDPQWRILTMQLAPAEDGGITFSVDRGDGGQPQKRGTLVLAADGQVLKWEPFSAGSTGRKLRSLMRFAHTGEVLGIVGQTIAGLVSAAAVLLVWTGLSLSLRRLAAWLRRRRGGRAEMDDAVGDTDESAVPAGAPFDVTVATPRRRRRKEYSRVA